MVLDADAHLNDEVFLSPALQNKPAVRRGKKITKRQPPTRSSLSQRLPPHSAHSVTLYLPLEYNQHHSDLYSSPVDVRRARYASPLSSSKGTEALAPRAPDHLTD